MLLLKRNGVSRLVLIFLSLFWLLALLNPVFKKYDYGAGFPLVILFGILLFVLAAFEYRKKREKAGLEQIFLWLFCVFYILSFIFSQTQNLGFSEVLAFSSVAIFYSIFAFKKIPWMNGFLKVIVWGLILSILMGFGIYFTEAEPRMFGPFFNIFYHANVWPNAFALFLLMSWPILLIGQYPKGKFWPYFWIILAMTALFLTFSRGALIVFGGQIFLLVIYFFKRIKFRNILAAILMLIFSLSLFFTFNNLRAQKYETIDVSEKITFDNEESLTSVNERKDFWLGAIELTKEKPLLGWGPFSFRQAYNGIQKTFLGNSDHPHNIFLKISAENGLLTLAAFLAFLFSTLIVIAKRFPSLEPKKKDLLYILFVSVAGAFAHNLIDYNFNFIANLLLLFIFMAFMRSLVVKMEKKSKASVVNLLISILIAGIAFYEGSLLVLARYANENYLNYSLFPRNYYLAQVDRAFIDEHYEEALTILDKHQKINTLDAQAWYLRGVIECVQKNTEQCKDAMKKALELNPMNDFNYYRDYLRVLEQTSKDEAEIFVKEKLLPLINTYFIYVENNVHFTAYTTNVEAAAEIINMLKSYLTDAEFDDLLDKKSRMLETANDLRKAKTF